MTDTVEAGGGGRLRILVIGPMPPPHHGVTAMTQLAWSSLRSRGYDIRLVDTADRRGIVNIGLLDFRNVVLGLWHTAQIWRTTFAWRPHIVLFPISQASLPFLREVLWMLGPLTVRARVVPVLHGAFFGQFYGGAPQVVRWLLRWLLARSARVVVLCKRAASGFAPLVPAERVTVIPNAVADCAGSEEVPSAGTEAGFRVLYLGNRIRAKGYLDLVAAAGLLKHEIPGLEVVIAGDRYDVSEAEERDVAARHGVSDIIRWVDVVLGEAKQELLRRSAVLAFPSYLHEGQPLVLLEAMAAGLPIVTTRFGCIPETVVEGENALLVAGQDAASLAQALRTLWRDTPMRRAFGQRSRELWTERYRPIVFEQRLAQLVEALATRE